MMQNWDKYRISELIRDKEPPEDTFRTAILWMVILLIWGGFMLISFIVTSSRRSATGLTQSPGEMACLALGGVFLFLMVVLILFRDKRGEEERDNEPDYDI